MTKAGNGGNDSVFIMNKLSKLKSVFKPRILTNYLLNKIFFNFKHPRYFPRVYKFAKRYVNFYQGDGNSDRATNGGWKFLESYIRNAHPKLVFDVGAFEGDYTLRMNDNDHSLIIHAFEPNPNSFQSLKRNCEKYANIKLVNSAMSNAGGEATLFINSEKGAINSLHQINKGKNAHLDKVKIMCDTVDRYCGENNIKFIDMLKIDTEGNDLNVLRGSIEIVRREGVGLICFEFNLLATFSHVYFNDFHEFLSPYGYELYKIKPLGLEKVSDPELERTTYAYFVAVKPGTIQNFNKIVRYA